MNRRSILQVLAVATHSLLGACAPCREASHPNIMETSDVLTVHQETDRLGDPFQTATIQVSSPVAVNSAEQNGLSENLSLNINDTRQSTLIDRGRAVGMERITASSGDSREFCGQTVRFYDVRVGFGTASVRIPGQSGLSVVGRQLQEGETLAIRFDLCTADGCVTGETRTFQVHLTH
jgi:hypothetical protein